MARYPLAIWTPLPGIGAYTEGPFKIVHHTTQGSSAAGAIATYRQTGSYPHFTVEDDVVYQHVDTTRAVTALKHPSGTVETNRSHAIQIELVGFAERPKSDKSLRTMAALCRWLEEAHGIPPTWPNGHPYPPVNGHQPNQAYNRNVANWLSKGGHYGHCHVPHNDHWDPGYTADEVAIVMGEAAALAEEPEAVGPMVTFTQAAASTSSDNTASTSYVAKLVATAKSEYEAFHTIAETDEPLRSRIDTYCNGIGIAAPSDISAFPWSATFVSWCVKTAGATASEFRFSAAHAVFVKAAIANADAQTGVFRARPINSYAPRIGDLVHRNRSGGRVTYAQARVSSDYISHSAIVVELGEDQLGRYAVTIGGNESDSIRRTRVQLDGAGLVRQSTANPFICVVQDLKVDAASQAAEPALALAATRGQRLAMAKIIVDFEARRDAHGRLVVYFLPPGDGGGRYEVAGINERFNKVVCDELVALVESGRQDEAERRAAEFIAEDTDVAAGWTSNIAIEFYLRDCVFNRGRGGAAWILQKALGVEIDQSVGPQTLAAVRSQETQPLDLLAKLRSARESYERLRRDETSRFWRGLVNRWNNALTAAKTFLVDGLNRTAAAEVGSSTEPDFEIPPMSRPAPEPEQPSSVASGRIPSEAEFEMPDGMVAQAAAPAGPFEPKPYAEPQIASAYVLRQPSPVSAQISAMHRQLEQQLFKLKPIMAQSAAASDAPPQPQDMIVGVGIGAAHRDFESIGSAGPGAPVLNVYVTEAMGMEAVKRVLVDHYGVDSLLSDQQPVNVHHTGLIRARTQTHRQRPSPCGISVGHFGITAGTQGVLARGSGGGRERRLLMLSNNHVLANENNCAAGDAIHQPGPMDLPVSPNTQIGILERWVPLDFNGGDNFVDCATAWCVPNAVRKEFIRQNAGAWSYFPVARQPVTATSGLQVGKSGRTTQLTSGRVVDVNASITVGYGHGKIANFKDQITVAGTDGRPFSAGGDSGSLIWTWDETRSPVALLFAGGRDYTFANKINHVLQALEIELYT